ncbi:MAG: hypothetical protein AAFP98_06745 [Pseudomonadota bacterium]
MRASLDVTSFTKVNLTASQESLTFAAPNGLIERHALLAQDVV